jgi:rhodanese-related sulfurtransferase
MLRNPANPWRQALWQVPAVICLAAAIGLAANRWRPDPLALPGDWSAETRLGDAAGAGLAISLEEARRLYADGAAVFLDARPANQYAQGHIRGALGLPWQEVDRYFMEVAERLDPGQTVITYCDGETCDLSHELALFLKDMGFADVHVLVNGWSMWREAGLPVEKSAD